MVIIVGSEQDASRASQVIADCKPWSFEPSREGKNTGGDLRVEEGGVRNVTTWRSSS